VLDRRDGILREPPTVAEDRIDGNAEYSHMASKIDERARGTQFLGCGRGLFVRVYEEPLATSMLQLSSIVYR